MKIKTPKQFQDSSGTVPQNVIRQIQSLTDDVINILSGSLNISDGTLPFQIINLQVKNGMSFPLQMNAPYSIIGCIPIQTNGCKIISFKTSINNRVFTCTLELDVDFSQVSLLLIGANNV